MNSTQLNEYLVSAGAYQPRHQRPGGQRHAASATDGAGFSATSSVRRTEAVRPLSSRRSCGGAGRWNRSLISAASCEQLAGLLEILAAPAPSRARPSIDCGGHARLAESASEREGFS